MNSILIIRPRPPTQPEYPNNILVSMLSTSIYQLLLLSQLLIALCTIGCHGWSISESFHYDTLSTFELDHNSQCVPPTEDTTATLKTNCFIKKIKDHCTNELLLKWKTIGSNQTTSSNSHLFDLDFYLTIDIDKIIQNNGDHLVCCSTWDLIDCILSHTCTECGTKAMNSIKSDLLIPLWQKLESFGKCKSYSYDSFNCNGSLQFWIFGTIFICITLIISLAIFLFYRHQNKRYHAPMYELFH